MTNANNWFCFGGETDESACYGDSGGPVMVQENKDQVWTLAGIISGLQKVAKNIERNNT